MGVSDLDPDAHGCRSWNARITISSSQAASIIWAISARANMHSWLMNG
jgi:hypothetical protein